MFMIYFSHESKESSICTSSKWTNVQSSLLDLFDCYDRFTALGKTKQTNKQDNHNNNNNNKTCKISLNK